MWWDRSSSNWLRGLAGADVVDDDLAVLSLEPVLALVELTGGQEGGSERDRAGHRRAAAAGARGNGPAVVLEPVRGLVAEAGEAAVGLPHGVAVDSVELDRHRDAIEAHGLAVMVVRVVAIPRVVLVGVDRLVDVLVVVEPKRDAVGEHAAHVHGRERGIEVTDRREVGGHRVVARLRGHGLGGVDGEREHLGVVVGARGGGHVGRVADHEQSCAIGGVVAGATGPGIEALERSTGAGRRRWCSARGVAGRAVRAARARAIAVGIGRGLGARDEQGDEAPCHHAAGRGHGDRSPVPRRAAIPRDHRPERPFASVRGHLPVGAQGLVARGRSVSILPDVRAQRRGRGLLQGA